MFNAEDIAFMQIARTLSTLSKCVSKKVGCIIVKDRRMICAGYNGTPSGHVNCDCVFNANDFDRVRHHEFSERFEIHAEMNAILFAAKEGISIKGTTLYTTLQPCTQCVKNLIQSGISKIVYSDLYDLSGWDSETYAFLHAADIQILHISNEPNK